MRRMAIIGLVLGFCLATPCMAQETTPITPVEFEFGSGAGFRGNASVGDTTVSVSYLKLGYKHRWTGRRLATGIGFYYGGLIPENTGDLERLFAYIAWDTFGSASEQFTFEIRVGYTSSPGPLQSKFTVEPLLRFNVAAFSEEVSLFASVGVAANGSNLGELFTLTSDSNDVQAYGGLRLVPRIAR